MIWEKKSIKKQPVFKTKMITNEQTRPLHQIVKVVENEEKSMDQAKDGLSKLDKDADAYVQED